MLEICLLGTGGMMPLPYRWLTSMMARYNGSNLLIDCGEGTQIAIKDKGWGYKQIDVICFTHFHADHISGLPGLLLAMGNSERTDPLTIIGPRGVEKVVGSLRIIAPELPFSIDFIEINGKEEVIEINGYATSLLAEAMAWATEQGMTMYELLCKIYREFGLYKEKLVSLTKKGISGTEEIKAMMAKFRQTPPTEIGGEKVVEVRDYKTLEAKDLRTGKLSHIDLPNSDVLQFFTEGGSKISIRPSGTEPKIKFYFSMKGMIEGSIEESMKVLDGKLEAAANLLTK